MAIPHKILATFGGMQVRYDGDYQEGRGTGRRLVALYLKVGPQTVDEFSPEVSAVVTGVPGSGRWHLAVRGANPGPEWWSPLGVFATMGDAVRALAYSARLNVVVGSVVDAHGYGGREVRDAVRYSRRDVPYLD